MPAISAVWRRRVDGFHERVLSQPAAYHEGPAVYAIIEDIGDAEPSTPMVKVFD